MEEIVVVAAKRTPTGAFMGELSGLSAPNLGSLVIKALLADSGVKPEQIDSVILGQVLTAGCGQNPARQAAIGAGLTHNAQCLTVNKVCGSGLKAVHLAMQAITCDNAEFVIAGGQESMSNAPHILPNSRKGKRLGGTELQDSLVHDGLWDAFNDYHMGVTAENVAKQYGVARPDQDEFAFQSHQKALAAQKAGLFANEIVPIEMRDRKGNVRIFSQDEGPRETSVDKLASLQPVFSKQGTVTAGNASSLNDGASALLLCHRDTAEKYQLKVHASIGEFSNSGISPDVMGVAPIEAISKCLDQSGWEASEVEQLECNEAFASQAIAVARAIDIPDEKINPYGGGIALGHAIGSSGSRILVTLIHSLIRDNKNKGLAALCIGGGEGVAMSIYR
ncbi:acetyl-CoA C-acetyltransferase [Vibrio europaeus]|uniref:acetyl-CoA C-acetyltransferase n=1 Tax=Vibrio europaeus TaxID=300876 RepID=UPI00234002F4|nr:acetyl-CoA C-acetyltransferase [Vibrio europaeus]MDC5849297.1 acetyl-CoA C-acetyltransferase [Vibrio europaeus]